LTTSLPGFPICSGCIEGYILDGNTNTCKIECTDDQFKNEYGVCITIPPVLTNCAIWDTKSTDADVRCDVCQKG